ncbi:MAG TPA: hypothetical protein PLK46_06410 [Propioniciclava sp.]|uniref:hypothetical protein n=1 Tax=Propioniciclava sp. TaxID=2038686 RepID=UPI002C4F39CB|nr:hypothetical protein [Propioniciclava sp.]HRL79947.1 hypothetical protein [Propioniciclava sp.]
MMHTSGLGSLPGTDVAGGVRFALEAASLPWLPEFPARGPWAGMIGRTLGMLEGIGAALLAGEWSLTAIPGVDQRRARATLRDDLDVLEENAQGLTGPLRITATGPWTLAATTLAPRGGHVLKDASARRDLAQSLAAGLTDLRAQVERRLPGTTATLQIDEPLLPAVLGGDVRTESGYARYTAVEAEEVIGALAGLHGDVLHCCAPGLDPAIVVGEHGAGFRGLALDEGLLSRADLDTLGPLLESGRELWLGCADARTLRAPHADALTATVLGDLRALEWGPRAATAVVLTPSCGLASWPIDQIGPLFAALRTAAERLEAELAR